MPFPLLPTHWFRRPDPTPSETWQEAFAAHPYASRLPPDMKIRLQNLAAELLRTKPIEGAHGLSPDHRMCAHVALRAAIPILSLGLEYYSGWYSIVLHPADFRVHDEFIDEYGIMHHGSRELCGESMNQGPVVLSWPAIEEDIAHGDLDLVIHECAHKIDLLNGDAAGFPPLHAGMDRARWTDTFSTAYEHFVGEVDAGIDTPIDPYAATDPAEFFAVTSEAFFVTPWQLIGAMPAVYEQLHLFYRQDPQRFLDGA